MSSKSRYTCIKETEKPCTITVSIQPDTKTRLSAADGTVRSVSDILEEPGMRRYMAVHPFRNTLPESPVSVHWSLSGSRHTLPSGPWACPVHPDSTRGSHFLPHHIRGFGHSTPQTGNRDVRPFRSTIHGSPVGSHRIPCESPHILPSGPWGRHLHPGSIPGSHSRPCRIPGSGHSIPPKSDSPFRPFQ